MSWSLSSSISTAACYFSNIFKVTLLPLSTCNKPLLWAWRVRCRIFAIRHCSLKSGDIHKELRHCPSSFVNAIFFPFTLENTGDLENMCKEVTSPAHRSRHCSSWVWSSLWPQSTPVKQLSTKNWEQMTLEMNNVPQDLLGNFQSPWSLKAQAFQVLNTGKLHCTVIYNNKRSLFPVFNGSPRAQFWQPLVWFLCHNYYLYASSFASKSFS